MASNRISRKCPKIGKECLDMSMQKDSRPAETVSTRFVLWLVAMVLLGFLVLAALFLGRDFEVHAAPKGLTVQTHAPP